MQRTVSSGLRMDTHRKPHPKWEGGGGACKMSCWLRTSVLDSAAATALLTQCLLMSMRSFIRAVPGSGAALRNRWSPFVDVRRCRVARLNVDVAAAAVCAVIEPALGDATAGKGTRFH
ncbi:hypothetical protein BIW11_03293 [Tropilaelaps mercedesae]|uniref:Uncharacterized protein n=1 Tax=Tropilaelaps mercedesae TaxID=418985 RepID=A0A1V9XPC3_9ACAR|nr:hypothetical protein BIW11_03293 [Tropilaelaps mercedesae]